MFISSHEYTVEEIQLISSSGLTISELNDFWSRFPDQEMDTAIGGAKMELEAKATGLTPALEVSHEANPDAPAPVEEGQEVEMVEESEVPSVGESIEEEASGKDTPHLASE